MSLVNKITQASRHARQTGRTTALVEAALKIGALFVCHSDSFAQQLKRRYPGLEACSLMNDHYWHGMSRKIPVIFDHLVIETETRAFESQKPMNGVYLHDGKAFKTEAERQVYKNKKELMKELNVLNKDMQIVYKDIQNMDFGKAKQIIYDTIMYLNSKVYHLEHSSDK